MFDFLKGKGKGKDIPGNIPVSEVQHLQSLGMEDKDIIKKLKEQGYGFSEIEKAMMHAVKGGVEPIAEPIPIQNEEMPIEEPLPPPVQDNQRYANEEPVENKDIFSQYNEETPTLGELEGDMGQMTVPGIEHDTISPDVAIEELVEGVVDEKWDDFSKRMERNDSILAELRTELRISQNKLDRLAQKPADKDEVSEEINQKMEDLEVRIASVERAFKQMLPNLTRNIQELTLLAKQKK
ncbi:hypothetical protein CL614_04715 [archaeon]|nr:hypothetical protein [archaeon]